MPELPEVETVARQLDVAIAGKKFREISIEDKKLYNPLLLNLKGASVCRVFRIGKEVGFELSKAKKKFYLSVHLRMSGRLIWVPTKDREVNQRWVRVRISSVGGELRFIDPRRFGTMRVADKVEDLSPRGLDPINDKFSSEEFYSMLNASNQELKSFLLRQDKLVGLGNIYASEILFDCSLHPTSKCKSLTKKDAQQLLRSTRRILKKAIKNCGTTFSDFQNAHGELGSYQEFLKVYNRAGEPCLECGNLVEKIIQQQRSTYFCGNCQQVSL
jgi:formamidopyrimidine-DNA glycosylase